MKSFSGWCLQLSEYDCQTQEFILKGALRSDRCSLAWAIHVAACEVHARSGAAINCNVSFRSSPLLQTGREQCGIGQLVKLVGSRQRFCRQLLMTSYTIMPSDCEARQYNLVERRMKFIGKLVNVMV